MPTPSATATARILPSPPQIAVEGCGHGELDRIYETMAHLERVDGKPIDLLICCGDFQVSAGAVPAASLAQLLCSCCAAGHPQHSFADLTHPPTPHPLAPGGAQHG